MPTVPRLNQPVEQRAFPNPRIDTQAPIEAFGGGRPLEQATKAISGAAKATIDFYNDQKKKADDVAVLDALVAAKRAYTDTLHDPKNGAYWRKGKDAFGVMDTHYTPYQKRLQEIEKSLANDEQKRLFARQASNLSAEMYESLQKHIGLQAGEFDKQATADGIKTSIDKAATDLNDIGSAQREMDFIDRLIRKNAERLGLPSETVEAQRRSAFHEIGARRIKGWLDRDQPQYAEFEYQRFREYLRNPEDLKRQIDSHSKDRTGRESAEQIWETANSPQDALDEAQRITDKATREAAVARIKELSASKEGREKAEYDAFYQDVSNEIHQTGQRPGPSKWNRLKPEHQRALLGVIERKARGEDVRTDLSTYYDLRSMATHPATRDKFLREDLRKYVDKLSPADFKKLVDLQGSLRRGDPNPKLRGILSTTQVINKLLDESKITNKSVRAQFFNQVNEQVMAHEQRTGKPATPDEVSQIANRLLKDEVISGGGFLGLWDSSKRAFQIKSDDIPKADLESILEEFKRQGIPDTPQNRRDAYLFLLETRRGSAQ